MKATALKAVLCVILFVATVPRLEAAMSARAIMKKQSDQHKISNEFEVQQMILIDKKGNKEKRKLQRWVKEMEKGVYRALVAFLDPADIKGVALLTWQKKSGADDQWLFLPAEGKMKRVASGSKSNYFMGTDFTYEDMESEELDSKTYKIVKEEKCGDHDCWLIEAKPKSKELAKKSGYGKRLIWVRKDIFVTVKAEFYSKRGKLIKVMDNRDWVKVSGSAWRAKKSLMNNLKKKHKTLIVATSRDTDTNISKQTFTEKFIKKGLHTK